MALVRNDPECPPQRLRRPTVSIQSLQQPPPEIVTVEVRRLPRVLREPSASALLRSDALGASTTVQYFVRKAIQILLVRLSDELRDALVVLHRVEGLPPMHGGAVRRPREINAQQEVMAREVLKLDTYAGLDALEPHLVRVILPIRAVHGE